MYIIIYICIYNIYIIFMYVYIYNVALDDLERGDHRYREWTVKLYRERPVKTRRHVSCGSKYAK